MVWVETVSWEPRSFVYHNFLTLEECEHLIALGRPTLVKSTVVDNDSGRSVDSRWDLTPVLAHATQRILSCTWQPAAAYPKYHVQRLRHRASGTRRVRTSSGTFLLRAQDEVVKRIEDRIARFSKIPFENGESFQILHYGKSTHNGCLNMTALSVSDQCLYT